MAGISDADKLGMAALIASTEGDLPQTVNTKKKADPINTYQIRKDVDAMAQEEALKELQDEIKYRRKKLGYKGGGMIDRAAIKGKTRGKIC